jgi:hypothetical protein
VSADTVTYEDDFITEPADPAEFGDAETRRAERAAAVQRDQARQEETLGDSAREFVTTAPKRSRTAKQYENKVADILRTAMRVTITSEKTVTDAAAILTYADGVAEKAGDLADQDERVAKAIDFINGGTENPYLNLAMAALPLVLQLVRNHEPDTVAEVKKEFKLFGRWTIKVPFRFRLRNKVLRGLTAEPKMLYDATFVPEVKAALAKQGINVPAYKG